MGPAQQTPEAGTFISAAGRLRAGGRRAWRVVDAAAADAAGASRTERVGDGCSTSLGGKSSPGSSENPGLTGSGDGVGLRAASSAGRREAYGQAEQGTLLWYYGP